MQGIFLERHLKQMPTDCLIIVCSRGLSRSFVFLAIVTRALPCQVVAIRCQAVDGRASNASTVWRQVAKLVVAIRCQAVVRRHE